MQRFFGLILTFLISFTLFSFISCKKEKTDNDNSGGGVPPSQNFLAFPGAEGGGKYAIGGRGGKVIKVTNLNDSGSGSLREAVGTPGPRIVIFEVSGNIELVNPLKISHGFITIAGQTAPGDGICIQGNDVIIEANHVILRYLRFRMGAASGKGEDALGGRNIENVIIDHCSMSWSRDESSSFYHTRDFTMQWCIISESLRDAGHPKGRHGFGGIWGGVNASFHHNLLAHHDSRNPRFDGGRRFSGGSGTKTSRFGSDRVDYRNNVIYNWMGNSAYGGENGEYNIVNNYYKYGPATPSRIRNRIFQVSKDNFSGAPRPADYAPGYGTFYITGNYVYGNSTVTSDNWNGGVDYDPGVTQAMVQKTSPFSSESIPAHTAEEAFDAVLKYAGASYKRDAIDIRIVKEVEEGTAQYTGSVSGKKGIIDSQNDVGGWPFLNSETKPTDTDGDGMPDDWEVANNLDPKKANANGRDLDKNYDNIEVYINSLVEDITNNQYK